MKLTDYERAEEFLAAASRLLLRDEARHNLIFGVCATLREAPATFPNFGLWTVEDESEILGAALMTEPFNLLVAKPHAEAALGVLAKELHRRGVRPPGVGGALPEAADFAAAWEEHGGASGRVRMRQGIYRAVEAVLPEGVRGRMRMAGHADRGFVLECFRAFEAESIPADAPRGETDAHVDNRLESSTGGVAIWEDEAPVSIAGFGGKTPHGMRIGPVYTLPELRRRGYASALVAQLTAELLGRGNDYCFLYTDLANPGANRIYQAVGYEYVCESVDIVFGPREER
jgi:uncharacterized protein